MTHNLVVFVLTLFFLFCCLPPILVSDVAFLARCLIRERDFLSMISHFFHLFLCLLPWFRDGNVQEEREAGPLIVKAGHIKVIQMSLRLSRRRQATCKKSGRPFL